MASNSRVWFITGTSSGLGRALLEVILAANERAVATLRKPEVLSSLQSKYPASQLLVVPLDVTVPAQITTAFETAKKHFGKIDVVVNNAGYAVMGEIEAIPDKDARNEFEVQFWGPVNITKEAVKIFREVNPPGCGGRIFNVSTIGGYSAKQTLSFYSASKFALEGFTESFIKEMPPAWNIKGCIIQPGGFETEWRNGSMVTIPPHPAYTDPDTPSSQFRAMHGSVPYIGSPEKIGKAIMTLASEPNPPLRIQFGSEAIALVTSKARSTINEAEKWAELSHSTNKDDVDVESYMKQIAVAST